MYYFDFAATTPVDKEVFDEMKKYFSDEFGNPLSLHKLGQNALKAIDLSREKVKNILEADSVSEIIFTASATESNNLIIKGFVLPRTYAPACLTAGRDYTRTNADNKQLPHIISTIIEHSSVIEVFKDLEKQGIVETTLISPDKFGLITFEKIKNAIKENTILLSMHYVNSETGIIQPIKEIAEGLKKINPRIIFHIDASQALTEDISVKNLGIDAMTLSGHKIYGPKGASLLYKKEKIELASLITGSGQEFGMRAGTENVAGIIGFAKAMEIIRNRKQEIRNRIIEIRDYFIGKLRAEKIDFEINAPLELCSPKILNLSFSKIDSQDLLVYLSENDICVSAGMSCKSRAAVPSPVIEAMYPNTDRAKKSIRFSFGKNTTKEEIDYLVKILEKFT